MGEDMNGGDQHLAAKKKVLMQLRHLARGKMAEGLKSKFHPPHNAPEELEAKEPAAPVEPMEGMPTEEKDDEEKLLAMLEGHHKGK